MSLSKQLKELPYIVKDNLFLLFPNIKASSFNQNIKNWLKKGELIKLKRGFYISRDYYDKCRNKEKYLNFLSSLICSPSYISRETVLGNYGVLTESVFGISAVTTKTTRNFISKAANFNYSKIKNQLFTGFTEKIFSDKKYYIATKAKALFDYLYFIKRTLKRINKKTVDELRINTEMINEEDWKEFEKYLRISKSEKVKRIYKALRK